MDKKLIYCRLTSDWTSPNIVTGSLKEKGIKQSKDTGNILPGSSSYIIKVNLIRRSPGSSYKTKYATYLGHMWSQPAIRLVGFTIYAKRTMNCLSTCRSDDYLDNISWHRWRFQTLARVTTGRLCCSLWRLALTLVSSSARSESLELQTDTSWTLIDSYRDLIASVWFLTAFVDVCGDLDGGVWVIHMVFEVRIIHKLQFQWHLGINVLTILMRIMI